MPTTACSSSSIPRLIHDVYVYTGLTGSRSFPSRIIYRGIPFPFLLYLFAFILLYSLYIPSILFYYFYLLFFFIFHPSSFSFFFPSSPLLFSSFVPLPFLYLLPLILLLFTFASFSSRETKFKPPLPRFPFPFSTLFIPAPPPSHSVFHFSFSIFRFSFLSFLIFRLSVYRFSGSDSRFFGCFCRSPNPTRLYSVQPAVPALPKHHLLDLYLRTELTTLMAHLPLDDHPPTPISEYGDIKQSHQNQRIVVRRWNSLMPSTTRYSSVAAVYPGGYVSRAFSYFPLHPWTVYCLTALTSIVVVYRLPFCVTP